jgi:phosphohistidine phosphatase SixA
LLAVGANAPDLCAGGGTGLGLSAPRLRFDERLILREVPADVAHVMIVGHNLELHELALELAQPGQGSTSGFADKFATATIASFTFDIDDWKQLAAHSGKLRLYITPKMLGRA